MADNSTNNYTVNGYDFSYLVENGRLGELDDFYDMEEYKAYMKLKKKMNKESKELREPTDIVKFTGEFKNPSKGTKFMLFSQRHDIHYKQQLWGVGERKIEYNIILVEKTGLIKNIVGKINSIGDKQGEIDKAERGDTVWYEIKTFETVPFDRVRAGYVKLYKDSFGKTKYTRYLSNTMTDTDKNELKEKVSKAMADIIKQTA